MRDEMFSQLARDSFYWLWQRYIWNYRNYTVIFKFFSIPYSVSFIWISKMSFKYHPSIKKYKKYLKAETADCRIIHKIRQIPIIFKKNPIHIQIQMIKNLSEKELGHAFFYSLKINDLEHAYYLLKLGAPINTSYFINQDELVYTINLVVARTAEIVRKNGSSHSKSQLMLRILDICLEQKPDLRCHCTVKNPHYCALSQAFKSIKFDSESDLFIQDNLLILKLLFHGASYRNLCNSKEYKWIGVNTLNSYIATKKADVIELLKMNRHAKCCSRKENRHDKCKVEGKILACQL